MLKTKCLLAGPLFVAGVALFAVTEVKAQIATPPFVPPPPLCTITGIGAGKSVMFEAGPNGTTFPEPTTCPEGVSGSCLKWPYRVTYTGLNPTSPAQSELFISFDSDTTVWTGMPPPVASNILVGVDDIIEGGAAERLLQFNAKTAGICTGGVCAVSFVTGNAGIGTLTAGFRHGNLKRTCAIAGADDPFGDPGLSQPAALETTALGCTVIWTQTPDGCVSGAEIASGSPAGCTIETNQQTNPVTNTATCTTEVNFPGSCKICKWNSSLKVYTCVTRTNINC